MPYIVMTRSAKVRGKAKNYGPYRHSAVVELEPQWAVENPDREPAMISDRAKGVLRIVRDTGGLYAGGKHRDAHGDARAICIALADHLNRLERAAFANEPITIAEIDTATNVEFQRELIEAFGGIEAYFGAIDARLLDESEFGRLYRHHTVGEAVVAVEVVCPSTGRRYMLRVPPTFETATAHEAVAWTFGLTAEQYHPTLQS